MYGWSKEESSGSLCQITVPRDIHLAPIELLKLIRCSCGSEMACKSHKVAFGRSLRKAAQNYGLKKKPMGTEFAILPLIRLNEETARGKDCTSISVNPDLELKVNIYCTLNVRLLFQQPMWVLRISHDLPLPLTHAHVDHQYAITNVGPTKIGLTSTNFLEKLQLSPPAELKNGHVCGQQDMSADPTIPNKMSDSERSGDYSVHLRYISPELSDIYVDEEKKITDESAAESILVLEPYMFEPYETENENTCLNVIQSRKLKGRLVGHRTSKYGMRISDLYISAHNHIEDQLCDYCEVMPLVIESWCCREIEEVHCETVRTQQDVLFIVETNSFRIQIVAWMQMFSVAQTMHTSTNMAGMHSNMSKIAVPKKRLLRDYPLLQFHTPFCRNKSQLVFVNIWHPRQSWNSYQRLHWNLRQNYLQKTSTRATLKCLENRTRTIYDAGIIIYHAIEDVCGVSDPWPPTFSSLGIDAVEACVPSPLYKLLAGVLVPMTS
ncbi:hypothetical protein GQR58_028357 [Nymphon striatum]|nr:hypothetical protein GQR58_028357 [Nymphon striatum]